MNPRTYILIFCLTLDAIYDAYFRTSPAKTQAEFAWTLFESLALYTVGSEILLSYAFVQFTERGAKGLADAGFVPWASTFACRLWTELCAAGRFGRQLLHNPQAVEDQLRRRANGHGQERGAPRERREYAQAADSYESEEEQRSYRGPGLFEQSEGV